MIEVVIVGIYAVLLALILIYCLLELRLAVHYLRSRKLSEKRIKFLEDSPLTDDFPHVTIQLPIFNELYVVERLIDQVAKIDYPNDRLEIQVLDDSTDETVGISQNKVKEYKAKGFDIVHIHRVDRSGFKAGALQNGMKVCKGEFIAIFDADFLPQPDFLKATLPHFQDTEIGVVQTKWSHINRDYSLLTRIQAFFLDAHFTVEQMGRNSQGYFMNFNGTAGVWRKATIEDAGGWQADTLTEDLDLSYRSQMKGWKFIFLERVLSPAELPADMKSFKSQQFRWIKGGAETARKILPKIVKSDLSFKLKVNAFVHLLSSSVYILIFTLVFLSVPLLILKNTFIEAEYAQYAAPFFLANLAIVVCFFSSNLDRYKKGKGLIEFLVLLPTFLVVTMGLSFHNALAALRGLARETTPFIRTPKFDIKGVNDIWKDKKYVAQKVDWVTVLEGVLCLYFLFGLVYGVMQNKYDLFPVHLMAFIGFSYVFYYSIRHVRAH